MAFSIGIVGLPNVGKSTLFQALTRKQILIANYPFATIEPNVGIVEVPDARLAQLAKISTSEKIIPTTISFVDIAGLVKGASSGEGLGNKFLSHIREVDAIAMVVRVFSDPNIIHVVGNVNPVSDIEVIQYELILADVETVARRIDDVTKKMKSGVTKDLEKQLETAKKIAAALDAGKLAASVVLDDEEKVFVRDMKLLTIKPMLYVLNVDEEALRDDAWKGSVPQQFSPQIAMNAKVEAELAELSLEEAHEYCQTLGIVASGLDQLVAASYRALGLITYLTTGPMETRAWTVVAGAKAPQAAGVIHSDFEKAFIRAEVFSADALIAAGSEAAAKEQGALRIEGKEYTMQDGDVVHFRVGV